MTSGKKGNDLKTAEEAKVRYEGLQ